MAASGARRLTTWLLGLVGLGGLAVVGAVMAWAVLVDHLSTPVAHAGETGASQVVEIPRGTGVAGVADRLFDAGLISQPLLFEVYVRLSGRGGDLKAGEYEFAAGTAPLTALEQIVAGAVRQYRVTAAEGLTTVQILALLEEHPDLTSELPAEVPAEGTLLPDTYFFERGASRADLLKRMQVAMEEAVTALWAERPEDSPLATPDELVTLASIVEKETGVADERPLVAGVFLNRLRLGMKLQSDPTTIYALTKGQQPLGRPLLRKDLEVADPYNTYHAAGLPPGPIANPGRASLEAVIRPEESDYLYFVADGSGGHAFAKTLQEHNRNVQAWRRFQRQQDG